ncbi:hypothetical protein N9L24_00955 [Candidatus Marinamargulisbacteria bacterium]|nr:hypothetical protein [Candidatus Marinamargulisbacteria bacterium]
MELNIKTLEKLRKLINEETEYRSGPKLVSFFNGLGFNDSYGPGFPSRWEYTDEKLLGINGTADLDKCIRILFSPINYIGGFDKLDRFIEDFNKYLAFDKFQVIRTNKTISFVNIETVTESEFLEKDFKNVNIEKIDLESRVTEILKLRLNEIEKCIKSDASLSVQFLCGSTLEGILLGLAQKYPSKFNQAKSAPKDKDNKVKKFQDWTLHTLIDVSCELGFIKEDVKKYCQALKDFRNYIHPYQQLSSNFTPDKYTSKLSWQVLKAAICQIEKKRD